jgi:hypothetical protein
MSEQPIVLRQSLIKALDEDKQRCPAKAKAIYIDGMESWRSPAMTQGLYFESLLYGNTDTGVYFEMERNKNGSKSEAQQRVEAQAFRVKNQLQEEFAMDFHGPREQITIEFENPRYVFRASLDMLTSMRIHTGEVLPNVILDFKITQSILSSFGDFAWGQPHTMDHTQAFAYSWAYRMKYGHYVPFYYLVMDLSPAKLYKFVGGYVDKTSIAEFKESLRKTIARIEYYDGLDQWPTVPSHDNCKGCPLQKSCPAYKQGVDIQVIWYGV